MASGEKIDLSAEPLYLVDVEGIVAAYAREGSSMSAGAHQTCHVQHIAEHLVQCSTHCRTHNRAADTSVPPCFTERKLAINCTWVVSGRSSEIAWTSLEKLTWDKHFMCVFAEIMQSKSTKMKLCPFVAARSRHLCFFVQYGDYLIMARKRPSSDANSINWLVPDLNEKGSSPAQVRERALPLV